MHALMKFPVLFGTLIGATSCEPSSMATDPAASQGGELDRALDARLVDEHVVLVFADDASADSVEEALREPAWQRALKPCRSVVVRFASCPALRRRFAVRNPPVVVLLDARGSEIGRCELSPERSEVKLALRSLAEVASRFETCRQRLSKDPDDLEARYWLGTYHWSRGEREAALVEYRKVLSAEVEPSVRLHSLRSTALQNVLNHFRQTGALAEAETLLRQVDPGEYLAPSGDRLAAQFCLVLRRRGRLAEAAEVVEAQLRREPSRRQEDVLLFALGTLQQEEGKRRAADATFQLLAERFPHSPWTVRAEPREKSTVNSRRSTVSGESTVDSRQSTVQSRK
jgi:tetratricopeptide (TPR) repeat protein